MQQGLAVARRRGLEELPRLLVALELAQLLRRQFGGCRLCERENCSQRAEPPLTRTLILDEYTRRVSSFAFSNAREL